MLDELPLGIFRSDSEREDGSLEAVLGDAASQTTVCLQYLDNPRFDATPALSATQSAYTETELSSLCAADALISMLQVSSQLARNSEKYYRLLSSVFTAEKLVWILLQPNPVVRAKCCNLVGNLCRYGIISSL